VPAHASGFASVCSDVTVADLYAVAIFRATAASLRLNDHTPMAVEGIDPGGRSFEWSRSNSCISGRARAGRRAWQDGRNRHRGRNWRDRRQYSEIALPDGPAIELDRQAVDGINRAFMPKVYPDVTGPIDPCSRSASLTSLMSQPFCVMNAG
jgi:hypothetical protein